VIQDEWSKRRKKTVAKVKVEPENETPIKQPDGKSTGFFVGTNELTNKIATSIIGKIDKPP
jgi:hypothetical protein